MIFWIWIITLICKLSFKNKWLNVLLNNLLEVNLKLKVNITWILFYHLVIVYYYNINNIYIKGIIFY